MKIAKKKPFTRVQQFNSNIICFQHGIFLQLFLSSNGMPKKRVHFRCCILVVPSYLVIVLTVLCEPNST
jgi:hypothetical protein